MQNPPLSYTIKENDTLVGKGIAFDCINFIRDKYEFTYSVVLPQQDVLGNLKTEGGLFEMLAQNVSTPSSNIGFYQKSKILSPVQSSRNHKLSLNY